MNRLFQNTIRGIFLLAFLLYICDRANSQSLAEYLVEASENNPELKASFLNYQSSLERVNSKGVLPDPSVSFGYFIQPINTRTGPQVARFGVQQMFPWLGTLSEEKKVYAALAKAEYEKFEQKKNELHFEISKTWFEIFEIQQKLHYTHQQHNLHYAMESLLIQKMSTGKASMADVLELQVMIDHHGNMVDTYEDMLEAKKIKFKLLLNRPADTSLALPDTISYQMENNLLALHDSILSQNHDLNSLKLKEEALANKITVAKKRGYPSFGLGLNYMVTKKRNDINVPENGKDAILPTLNIQIPIFRKKYKSLIKENEYMQESTKSLYLSKKNELETKYHTLLVEYRTHQRNIELYNKLIRNSKKAKEVEMNTFLSGKTAFENVLDLLELMYKYQLKKVTSQKKLMEIDAEIKSMF